MESAIAGGAAERRRTARLDCLEAHGIESARVRPGSAALLINISSDGALVETGQRLLPGSSVDLLLERSQYRASVRGRVLRCAVVRVQAASMCYRGAIAFDRSLPWFVEHERAAAAREVV